MFNQISDSLSESRHDPDQAQKLLPVTSNDRLWLDNPHDYDINGRKKSAVNNIVTLDTVRSQSSYKSLIIIRSCFRKVGIVIMGIEWIAYATMMILFLFKQNSSFIVWGIVVDYNIMYRLMTIILQATTIIICLEFLIQFALFVRNAALKNKNKKNISRLLERKQKMVQKNKTDSNKDDNLIRLLGYLFNAGLMGILGLDGDLVSFINIISMLYYLYNGTIYLIIALNDTHHDIDMRYSTCIIYTIYNFMCAFGFVLPGICINLMEKIKLSYQNRSRRDNPSKYINASNRSETTVGAVTSFVNNKAFRVWITLMFSMSLIVTIVEITANTNDFLYHIAIIYSNSMSSLNFYVSFIVLRPFGMIVIINTILLTMSLSFSRKYRASVWFSSFDTFLKPIPAVFGAYIFLIVADNNIVMMYFSIVVCTAMVVVEIRIWLLLNFIAYRPADKQQRYSISRRRTDTNVFYVFAVCVAVICFVVVMSLIATSTEKTELVPMIAICCFNSMQIMMMIPLSTISKMPSFLQLSLQLL